MYLYLCMISPINLMSKHQLTIWEEKKTYFTNLKQGNIVLNWRVPLTNQHCSEGER